MGMKYDRAGTPRLSGSALPELKRRGKTVVAITHDDRYFASADRIVKLEEGKMVEAFRHEQLQEAESKQL